MSDDQSAAAPEKTAAIVALLQQMAKDGHADIKDEDGSKFISILKKREGSESFERRHYSEVDIYAAAQLALNKLPKNSPAHNSLIGMGEEAVLCAVTDTLEYTLRNANANPSHGFFHNLQAVAADIVKAAGPLKQEFDANAAEIPSKPKNDLVIGHALNTLIEQMVTNGSLTKTLRNNYHPTLELCRGAPGTFTPRFNKAEEFKGAVKKALAKLDQDSSPRRTLTAIGDDVVAKIMEHEMYYLQTLSAERPDLGYDARDPSKSRSATLARNGISFARNSAIDAMTLAVHKYIKPLSREQGTALVAEIRKNRQPLTQKQAEQLYNTITNKRKKYGHRGRDCDEEITLLPHYETLDELRRERVTLFRSDRAEGGIAEYTQSTESARTLLADIEKSTGLNPDQFWNLYDLGFITVNIPPNTDSSQRWRYIEEPGLPFENAVSRPVSGTTYPKECAILRDDFYTGDEKPEVMLRLDWLENIAKGRPKTGEPIPAPAPLVAPTPDLPTPVVTHAEQIPPAAEATPEAAAPEADEATPPAAESPSSPPKRSRTGRNIALATGALALGGIGLATGVIPGCRDKNAKPDIDNPPPSAAPAAPELEPMEDTPPAADAPTFEPMEDTPPAADAPTFEPMEDTPPAADAPTFSATTRRAPYMSKRTSFAGLEPPSGSHGETITNRAKNTVPTLG